MVTSFFNNFYTKTKVKLLNIKEKFLKKPQKSLKLTKENSSDLNVNFNLIDYKKDHSLHILGSFSSRQEISSIIVFFEDFEKKSIYLDIVKRTNKDGLFTGIFFLLSKIISEKKNFTLSISFYRNNFLLKKIEKNVEINLKSRLEKWSGNFEKNHPQQNKYLSNFKSISALKNSQKGKVCFLVGNGPSVRIDDLNAISDAFSFGCNRIYLAYNSMDFRPSYLMSSDRQVINDFGQEMIDASNGNVIFVSEEIPNLTGDFLWLKHVSRTPLIIPLDITRYVMPGGGTLISALQVGIYLGIRHFYIYGMDHSFTYVESGNKSDIYRSVKGDENHFIKSYRSDQFWCPPSMEQIEGALLSIQSYLEPLGGWIKNATHGGALNILERVNFDQIKKHRTVDDLCQKTLRKKTTTFDKNNSFLKIKGEVIWSFEKHNFGFARSINNKNLYAIYPKNTLVDSKKIIKKGSKINFYPYQTELGFEALYYDIT